jgi:site-specific recombinase XerD
MSKARPIRSYAEANRRLVDAFVCYLEGCGFVKETIRSYRHSVVRLIELLGAQPVVNVDRTRIRELLAGFYCKGLRPNTIRLHTEGLRKFFKFVCRSGLTKYDPTLMVPHSKLPKRLPRVLSVEEIEKVIGVAKDPFERTCVFVGDCFCAGPPNKGFLDFLALRVATNLAAGFMTADVWSC